MKLFSFNRLMSKIEQPLNTFKKVKLVLKEPTKDTVLNYWCKISNDVYLDLENDIIKTGIVKSTTEEKLIETIINTCVDTTLVFLGYEKKDKELTLNFRRGHHG